MQTRLFSPTGKTPPAWGPSTPWQSSQGAPIINLFTPPGGFAPAPPPPQDVTRLDLNIAGHRQRGPKAWIAASLLLSAEVMDPVWDASEQRMVAVRELPAPILCPSAPKAMALRAILSPLISPSAGPTASISTFVRPILRGLGVDLRFQLNATAISLPLYRALLDPTCWSVGDRLHSAGTYPWTLHALDFLLVLDATYTGRQFPSEGLTVTQASILGRAVFGIFAVLKVSDLIRPESNSFGATLLGSALQTWRSLPNTPLVQEHWVSNQRKFSFEYLRSLSIILDLFKEWTESILWDDSQDRFRYRYKDAEGYDLLDIDPTVFLPDLNQSTSIGVAVRAHLARTTDQWGRALVHRDTFVWSQEPPPEFFRSNSHLGKRPVPLDTLSPAISPPLKKAAPLPLSGTNLKCRTPMFALVEPVSAELRRSKNLLSVLPSFSGGLTHPVYYNFTTEGLSKACSGQCITGSGGRGKSRLHVCLSDAKWSDASIDWVQIVVFLRHEHVARVLRPTAAFLALLPPGTFG
jgi:hypothetical protein